LVAGKNVSEEKCFLHPAPAPVDALEIRLSRDPVIGPEPLVPHSNRQATAPFAAAPGKHRSTGPGAHAHPKPMRFLPSSPVRLERPLQRASSRLPSAFTPWPGPKTSRILGHTAHVNTRFLELPRPCEARSFAERWFSFLDSMFFLVARLRAVLDYAPRPVTLISQRDPGL
jgi:hypothetical protein